MSRPSVSVVFAAYNATWCIARAIDSVLAQTVPVLEILVCDDGSTDGMPDHIEARYGERVQVLRLPHRNAAAARRDGLAIARGDWLAFLDADDWWEPHKLEHQLDTLARHPEVRWLSSDGDYVSEQGVVKASWLEDYFQPVRDQVGDLLPALVQRCFPLMSSMLVERGAYHECGGIDPTLVYSHDYDLWMRLGARHPGAIMAEKLMHYWFHPGALSRNFEGRHRDNLVLLERLARGELRADPAIRRAAATRAIALAFDVGVAHLRAGRFAEGRTTLRRASQGGPLRRRALALLGSLVPDRWTAALMRSRRLKRLVGGARPGVPTISDGGVRP